MGRNFDPKKDTMYDDEREHDSSDDEQLRQQIQSQQSGLSIEQFRRLKIPKEVMKDGMIFIWVEKEYIYDVITHLETQDFYYVENVCYVMLDKAMEKGK